jgi:hypothetical protein
MADGINLDAVNAALDVHRRCHTWCDARVLALEVERLRADNERISAAWADVIQREQRGDNAHEYDVQQVEAERDAALARIRAVEALFDRKPDAIYSHEEATGYSCALWDVAAILADPGDAELIRTAEQRMANDDGRRYTLDEVTAALAAPTEDSDR